MSMMMMMIAIRMIVMMLIVVMLIVMMMMMMIAMRMIAMIVMMAMQAPMIVIKMTVMMAKHYPLTPMRGPHGPGATFSTQPQRKSTTVKLWNYSDSPTTITNLMPLWTPSMRKKERMRPTRKKERMGPTRKKERKGPMKKKERLESMEKKERWLICIGKKGRKKSPSWMNKTQDHFSQTTMKTHLNQDLSDTSSMVYKDSEDLMLAQIVQEENNGERLCLFIGSSWTKWTLPPFLHAAYESNDK